MNLRNNTLLILMVFISFSKVLAQKNDSHISIPVSLAQSFKQFNLGSDFIEVGILNKYPDRFSRFSSGFNSFLNFI